MKFFVSLLLSFILVAPLFAECHCYDVKDGHKNDCTFGGCLMCTGNFACCTETGTDTIDGTACSSITPAIIPLYNCAATNGNCYSGSSSSSSSSSSSGGSCPTGNPACSSDSDCPIGIGPWSNGGTCINLGSNRCCEPSGVRCMEDANCSGGQQCCGGVCVVSGSCCQ